MPKNNQQFQYNGKTVVWKKDEPKIWSCTNCVMNVYNAENEQCRIELLNAGLPDCCNTKGYYVELKTETK